MADLSDDEIATLWAMACERERPTSEMVRAFAHAVIAADRALNAPQAAPVAQAERAGWQPIETADPRLPALLFAPGWQLSEDPRHPGEIRVASPRNWTWATHWMPIPAAPTPDQTKG